MRVYVQIEFGGDIDAAVSFLEDNDIEGRVLFDTSLKEARKQLDELVEEEKREAQQEKERGGGVH